MPRWNVYDPIAPASPPDSPRLPRRVAALSLEEINCLSYKKAVHHLREHNLHTRHLKTLSDMRDFLRSLYHPAIGPESDNTDILKTFKDQTEAFRKQQSQLADICDLFEEKFTDDCNPRITDIEKDMEAGLSKTWKANLRQLKKVLRSHKTPILVAGETGSGKSSLINLLINRELLPEAEHPCTASICVVKNSERSFVQLRRSKTDCQEVDVSDSDVWREFVNDRSAIEADDAESAFCRRAVFHTPLPHFQEGTYFVDSPGFREGPMLTQILLKYMSKASAFVIVLMTDDRGGLNETVKEFITGIRQTLNDISLKTMDNEIGVENVNNVTVNNVIFVFNRWDIVTGDETAERAKEIRDSCLEKLGELWPVIKEGENVFFLSVTKNFVKVSQNVSPDLNFVKLQTAVYSLIPKSHESRVTTAYMWLEQLARRISCISRNKINMAKLSGEDKTKQQQRLHKALEHVREAGQPLLRDLNATIDARQAKFLEDMLCHLRSEEALKRMCSFEEDEKVYGTSSTEVDYLPDQSSFSELWHELHSFFMRRVWREAKFWNQAPALSVDPQTGERRLHAASTRFEVFTADLRDLISSKVAEIDAEAQMLRALLDKEDAEPAVTALASDDPNKSVQFRTVEKALFGITAIIWVPLAVVGSVVSLPIMAGIFARQRIEGNMKLRKYRENKANVAAHLLTNFVNLTLTEELLKQPMDYHIKVSALKAQAEKYFPSVIEEFGTRIERLTQDERSQAEISESFAPILTDARQVLSHLYNFAAQNLRLFTFCEDHFSDMLIPAKSSGDFCFTVPAYCRSLEQPKVSVKIVREPISSDNAYRIFREEQAWRKLGKYQHLNIVLFYGLVGFGSPKKIGFVMERCEQNLADLVFSTPSVVPYGLPQDSVEKHEAFNRAAAMALQITTALSFIHQHNYIHRNLVMETVSVFRDGLNLTLKLCDFGLSRADEDITTTVAGTLVYLSPEVLNLHGCSAASDVYALGLLLWEAYHGERVFNWVPARDRSIKSFQDLYSSGRMELMFKDAAMPEDYCSLVQACTQLQAGLRPPINEVFDRLKKIAPDGKDEVRLPGE